MNTLTVTSQDEPARARDLAAQMNDWLATGARSLDGCPPDVVEWCRSARDVLAHLASSGPAGSVTR